MAPKIIVDKFGSQRVPSMSEFNEIESSIRERDSLVRQQSNPGRGQVRRDD